MSDTFEKQCLEILSDKMTRGEISRRRFTQIAAFLLAGAPLALKAKGAMAAANELVFVNWGGDAGKAYDAAYGQAFQKETGIPVKQDGSGPTEGAIEAQVKSGKPSWDLVDADPFSAEALGKKGLMEPIDYKIVDKSKMRPGFGWEYAASSYFFSYIIAYDSSKFGDKVPTGMADFFDVEKFPGKRSLYKWGVGMWEAALLADGVPVGIIEIPRLGIREVISEGTSSGVLTGGPGHRRDTVLPGQVGVSVVMGRAAAFGGPFGRLQSLQPGDTFEVRTGQGAHTFEVLGVRYAGDPTPPAPARGESRLILMTARGAPYVPTGIAYVDATLTSPAQPAGARQTTPVTLPPSDRAMATDTSTVWALVFALQFLVAAEVAAVWAFRRVGAQKTWIVFVPVLLLASVFVCDQLVRLLPNLL